ncbi:TetR/AcrR family transcriptional regulator [Paenibacillus paridis]|uniref:TetR/AcrR family transcriptional regulator n=1 Tax=Paenibacillus paridis TaxID=2583376 RepID=UPI001121A64F|nr:TetR/AcrR family transcriptional regulator [Paenibacillus paridis]
MRTLKEPEERKNEILDTAEALFHSKGYDKTTINDILKEIGIAKGTFYYYFKSKEEVMDAIVVRIVDSGVLAAKEIAANASLTVHEKFLYIMLAQKPASNSSKSQLIETLHDVNNAQMHQKSLSETVRKLTPILQEVTEQGIQEKLFATPYPREAIELLLVTAVTLFDEGIFNWQPQELSQKIAGFIHAMETLLGAEKGSFAYVARLFEQADPADGKPNGE